ncbi:hypothetical protein DEU56DRAFT_591797 [Suillus clintonianus]|uniref:uncharacterized protein n=1 Tax=Suillus clintonianus TaxID=1904413 RepID=UPI001B86D567|nr:uncharacterized protein DEU56DRAFT_591797 [Suillus clintonianus]KAG2124662.1 hypothetical protein DEU56DRAFT_591797 [Suillus clintonianus]
MVETLVKEQNDLLDMDVACGFGSPLIFAISSNTVFLRVFLTLGIDLNKPSSVQTSLYHKQDFPPGSYTPVSWAAAIGSKVAVDLLLSRPEVNLPDDILHTAVVSTQRSPEIINKLCQRGADVSLTVDGSTLIHTLLSQFGPRTDTNQWLPVVKTLIGDLSVQDWTARTVLHIALDNHLSDIVAYLLEQNAQLTATATLHRDIWIWAKKRKWFAKVGAAIDAAEQPSTRILGKIIDATATLQLVEFPGAVTTDHDDPNPICAVVVSVINRKPPAPFWFRFSDPHRMFSLEADLSRGKSSLQSNTQSSPRNDELATLKCRFSRLRYYQKTCSRLFDYHQGDAVTSMLRQLTQEKDSTGDSLFLQMTFQTDDKVYDHDYTLDIYRGPLH